MTLDFVEIAYPQGHWTHAYTDGSPEQATSNGAGGIYISLNNRTTTQHAIPKGKYSTNYKTEIDALQTGARLLLENKEATYPKVVIFSDALSVLQALLNPKNKELDMLLSSQATLQQSTERTIIQWIPSHCNISGNEEADRLAKDGGKLTQDLHDTAIEEVKDRQRRRWLKTTYLLQQT